MSKTKTLGLSTITSLRALVLKLRTVTCAGTCQVPHMGAPTARRVMDLAKPLIGEIESLLEQDGWVDLVKEDRQAWREQRYGKLLPGESESKE